MTKKCLRKSVMFNVFIRNWDSPGSRETGCSQETCGGLCRMAQVHPGTHSVQRSSQPHCHPSFHPSSCLLNATSNAGEMALLLSCDSTMASERQRSCGRCVPATGRAAHRLSP